jgi:hypothetical protein
MRRAKVLDVPRPRREDADAGALASRMACLLDLGPGRILPWLFARAVDASPYWAGMADLARTPYSCLP